MKACSAILASGESKRYGKNKLMERINGRTFVEIVVDVAKKFGEVFVVSKELLEINVDVIINKHYREGISRSVSISLEEAEKRGCSYLLIFLGDMPFIKEKCVEEVIEAAKKSSKAILYPYSERYGKGFPTLVKKTTFNLRNKLLGDKGLKQIIYQNPQITEKVPIEISECYIDIDTPEDLKAL